MLNPLTLLFRINSEDENFIELFFKGKRDELEVGVSYIIKEKRNVKGMEIFTSKIASGYRGMYITRQHPNHISKRYVTNGMDIIWLSTTIGKSYVDPHNLSTLFNLIRSFVENNKKTIILLDGMEYLMINNVYVRLIKFIEQIKEITVNKDSILLISVDENAFESKEISLLEKGLRPIKG